MLDMGFIRDINRIMKLVPEKRQSLLFSATMPQNIASLAAKILKDPSAFEVTPEVVTVEKIDQSFFLVPQKAKKHWLIKNLPGFDKTVIFTRTKHGANRLSEDLDKAGSPRSRSTATRARARARRRSASSMPASSRCWWPPTSWRAASSRRHHPCRELRPPEEPESYVHRIGRTARAGKSGMASPCAIRPSAPSCARSRS